MRGSHSTHFGHDDWAPFAPGMKTLSDGEGLRRRIVGALEKADCEPHLCVREQWLTFVLVGAGPTGCELAGQPAEQFAGLRPPSIGISTRAGRPSSWLRPGHVHCRCSQSTSSAEQWISSAVWV